MSVRDEPQGLHQLVQWILERLRRLEAFAGGSGDFLTQANVVTDHDDLSNVTPNQHHTEVHDDSEHSDGPNAKDPHDILTVHDGFPGGTDDFLREDGTWADPCAGCGGGAHDILSSDHTDSDDTDTPADEDLLQFDIGDGKWKAQPASAHGTHGGGGGAFNVETASADDTAAWGDLWLVDTSGGDVVITMASAAAGPGEETIVKKVTSDANIVRVQADGADTIDGVSYWDIADEWGFLRVVSNG